MSVSAGAKVQRRTSGLSDKVRKRIEITILSLPALIMFLGFVILPVFMAGYYGFFKWKGYGKPTVNGQFIGFENYKVILTDPNFQQALGHTLFVVVASLVIQGPLAILFALLLNQKFKGRALIRTLIFVPYVVSEVIVGTGWSLILQTTGALNALLKKIGLGGADWISDPKIAIWTLMFIISWKYIGFAVILMIAGMQSIPEDLYEAAKVDGAGFWRQQWSITPATARPHHSYLGIHVDYRFSSAVRLGLHHLGPVRVVYRRNVHHGNLHGARRSTRQQLWLRFRRGRGDLHHLAGHCLDLPAVRT